jgi:hypothetical protein
MLDPAVSPPGRSDDDARPLFYLRAPCFTSTELWDPERIGALVLYCSDGRWGEAFDEFCHYRLLIPRYDRWAVPGGPVCLLPRDSGGNYCQVVWDQLRFLVRAHELQRIVLIAHYGCAYYAERLGKDPGDCLLVQAEDLHTAAAALRRGFAGIGVDTYLAVRHGVILSFHEVDAH